MDNEKKDTFDIKIDDIPDLDLEILDDLVDEPDGEQQTEQDLVVDDIPIVAEESEDNQELSVEDITPEADVIPEITVESDVEVTPGSNEAPVDGQVVTPAQESPAPEPVEELIFGEEDKITLFDEPDDDDDMLLILDNIESDLPSVDEEDDEDLIFVDAVSVRDRRKIAKIKMVELPEDLDVEKKKTRRRTHDVSEIKKERSIAFARKNIIAIGIGALVLIVIIGGIVVGVKTFKENHSSVPKTSASDETYQVKEQEAINELMNSYFTAVADNDTYVLNEILNPVFDNEMEYFRIMSEYVDGYENIVCYVTEGMEESDYIVAAYYELKFSKVRETAPGMQFFYVETNEDGELYINNLYSQHNLIYAESQANTDVVNMISAYQTDSDMQSMMTQVQTSYDEALATNTDLKEMLEVTLPTALADWTASMEAYLNVQTEEPVQDLEGSTTEDPEGTADQEPETPDSAAGVTETPADGYVYSTDAINIRQSPTTDSAKLASVSFGAELTRVAVTDNGWTKIKTGDITGYVKSEYVSDSKPSGSSLSPGSTVTVKDTVKVRAGKGTEYDEVTVVLAGKSVTILEGDSEGWTKVEYAGATGYIRTDLLVQ